MDSIKQTLIAIKKVEEKFSKIQENSAIYVSENGGLTKEEIQLLDRLIELSGEVNLVGDAILKRYLTNYTKINHED